MLIHAFAGAKRHQVNTFGSVSIEQADAIDCYDRWPAPTMIHVDGPYGIGGYPGDPTEYAALPDLYFSHVAAWSKAALPQTTLWFWGTELGWATMHPMLDSAGWEYQELCIWNKGKSHVAGKVNSKTVRGVPVVTEVCARYTKRTKLKDSVGRELSLKEWVRSEWERSGVPLYKANEACGVKNAATRKYLTKDSLWYFPPAHMMKAMADYLHQHGKTTDWPYYSLDGESELTVEKWSAMRAKWNHIHGVTNVWDVPPLNGQERKRIQGSGKALHLNQKPLSIMKYLIETTTDFGDVIWDPFAGLASAGVCANGLGRRCYCSEVSGSVYESAIARLRDSKGVDICRVS